MPECLHLQGEAEVVATQMAVAVTVLTARCCTCTGGSGYATASIERVIGERKVARCCKHLAAAAAGRSGENLPDVARCAALSHKVNVRYHAHTAQISELS